MRFDTRPSVVAYPVGPEQISTAILAGASQGLPVVARSGGVRLTFWPALHNG